MHNYRHMYRRRISQSSSDDGYGSVDLAIRISINGMVLFRGFRLAFSNRLSEIYKISFTFPLEIAEFFFQRSNVISEECAN